MKPPGSPLRCSQLAALLLLLSVLLSPKGSAQTAPKADSPLFPVGAASRDITPDYPIRLSGYGGRREPSKGIAQRIHAKALAIGGDTGPGPALVLTVDNCGIPASMRAEVLRRIAAKVPLKDEQFAVCSSHTHCAPMLAGILPNLFGMDIPQEHQVVIERYTRELTDALEQVALDALAVRKPSRLAWGIGSVNFASNRRAHPTRPVDHALPLLRISDAAGKITALFTSYACHCTTIGIDEIHADWAGCAQEAIEREFPGAIALTAIGCGADQNPIPRRTMELVLQYGEALAAEVTRIARSPLLPISKLPEGRNKPIQLAYDTLPSRDDWQKLAASSGGAVAYHAKKNLARLERGESIPTSLPYLVQTWTFGPELAMVFLPGEVVVDYSLRLKTEFDHNRLWVNGYSNDVPAYIPSRRILEEGGYEGGGAMVYYDRPTRFASDVEERIIAAVREILPADFKPLQPDPKASPPAGTSPFVSGAPRLTLPSHLYALVGNECAVVYANTILAEDANQYRFEVECPLGKAEDKRWTLQAGASEVGQHPFTLRLLDASGRRLASASATLHVTRANAGSTRPECTVLIVGDSLTAAGVYPEEVARLFSQTGNPKLTMLGTQTRRPSTSLSEKVAHEGYGGWTWKSFLTRYEAAAASPGKINKSPFVFPTDQPPVAEVDFARYLQERADGRVPEIITVFLGINDCFRLKADNPTALDQGITEMLFNAEKLLSAFRKAAPKATIGICLVPPPNDREGAFEANYKGLHPRSNWKLIQHRVVERQLKHFFGREKENLEVVPVGLNLDTWNGYPEANAVHPNETGYRQIASSLHAWMKHRLALLEAADSTPNAASDTPKR